MNNDEASIEPCGNPQMLISDVEYTPLYVTNCSRSVG